MNLRRRLIWLLALIVLGGPRVFGQAIITNFSPVVGAPGDVVMLTGSHFTSPGGVLVQFWQGVTANINFINSDSLMTVTVPGRSLTGPISIQSAGSQPIYTSGDFTVIGSGPYISDVSPPYGSVNDLITISGVHLTNLLAVTFNGTAGVTPSVNAAGNVVTARVPPGATSGFISISTIYGTSNSPAPFTVLGQGPFISGFSPGIGNPGTTVFIEGVHFTGATNATFNGLPGLNFVVQSDTLVRADTPPNVSSGPVAVSSALGTWITDSNFFVPPTLTNFSPIVGRAGTNVLITGLNFRGATNVSFSTLGTTNFTVLSNTAISVTVPVGAVSGLVRVITPAGSAFSTNNFTVQPSISGFLPAFGAVGTPVTIMGANLNVGTPVVRFNGVAAAAPTGISFGQLTNLVPAGATTGPISVTTTDGSYTNANLFYLPASISSFTPTNSPPGTTITIQGQNLLGASALKFNGTAAGDFQVTNNVVMSATVPAGVTTGPISVTTPAGTFSSAAVFYGAPVITNFTPTHGLPGATVTIGGSSFLGASTVQFGGVAASFIVKNNGQISAIVPNGAQTGPITVNAPAGTNTSAGIFTLDYTSDLSVVIAGNPNPVTVGSNLLYTVSILNNGPYPAQNVKVTNTLPTSVTLKSVVASAGWIVTTNGNTLFGSVTNLINNGAAALLINVVPQAIGDITDTASVGSDFTDPLVYNNVSTITTTVDPLALLSITLLTNQVKVAWPLALSNYVLEYKQVLATNAFWSNVTATSMISGDTLFVTQTNSGAAKFYRLRH